MRFHLNSTCEYFKPKTKHFWSIHGLINQFYNFRCQQILCAQEGTLTVTSRSYSFKQAPGAIGSPAFEKTSCGNGKWCVAGECKADPAAPKGDIPVEYHAFCEKVAKYFGNDYVCETYFGACYQLCHPGSTVIKPLSTQSMSNWLASNNVDNTHIL